jgi:hypothetical protein
MGYRYFKQDSVSPRREKPTRDQLGGLSPSQFKTLLKRRGYLVGRDFFKRGSMAQLGNRLYRFRWWGGVGVFVTDISCQLSDFDRWANSVDRTVTFYDWQNGVK